MSTAKESVSLRWSNTELIAILNSEYQHIPQRPSKEPLVELVLTLLSQHTSDHNSGRAMHRLLESFPSWEDVISAPTSAVEDAIRPGGLAPTKAPRLQALLAEIRDRTDFDLSALEKMPLAEAKSWLCSLPGVGPKTAACVLLFALGRPALPVDTHVARVSRRLGLIPDDTSVELSHDLLENSLDPKQVYPFHINLIQHGRRCCHARSPKCQICPLVGRCPRIGLGNP